MRRAEARREGQTEQATRPADKSRKPRDKGEDLAGRSEDPPPRTRGRMPPRERLRAPKSSLFPSRYRNVPSRTPSRCDFCSRAFFLIFLDLKRRTR